MTASRCAFSLRSERCTSCPCFFDGGDEAGAFSPPPSEPRLDAPFKVLPPFWMEPHRPHDYTERRKRHALAS